MEQFLSGLWWHYYSVELFFYILKKVVEKQKKILILETFENIKIIPPKKPLNWKPLKKFWILKSFSTFKNSKYFLIFQVFAFFNKHFLFASSQIKLKIHQQIIKVKLWKLLLWSKKSKSSQIRRFSCKNVGTYQGFFPITSSFVSFSIKCHSKKGENAILKWLSNQKLNQITFYQLDKTCFY